MIDPIFAHYYFSVISHFGSGDRITVLIFSTVNQLTFFKQDRLAVHVWSENMTE